ncbi:hypothetical protein Golax_010675, partial [Gossypium laxum]|nr:hypothetical protein [Gossypium laxum]
ADNRVLEAFIHNFAKPPIPAICGYLQEARFLHVECTITLEDLALQLSLSIDGSVVTRSVIVPGKEDLCVALLGKVPKKFDSGRILMNWLEKKFDKSPVDATEPHYTEICVRPRNRIRCTSMVAYSCCSRKLGGGYHFYVPDLNGCYTSTLTPTPTSYLVSVQSVGQSEDMGCEGAVDSVHNMEIQEPNWVMRQFRWRQKISPPPQNLKELHKVDMCRKNDEDWQEVHNKYIEA